MARPRMERIFYTTRFESISVDVTEESLQIIKDAMQEKGISQTDLWKKFDLGLTRNTVLKLFGGTHHIRLHSLKKIIDFLEIKALIKPLGE